ncbi:MAG: WYL domain-containing protein [Acidimicrobiia bacterium]|nr:WYL domain-containing protein [Acidimicrobiia bacterium]
MTSPRTASRLNRILTMLPWVIANSGATVTEVCERFGYTRRELVKDLDLVFVCGLPGYGPGDLMVAYVDEDEVVVEMADYFAAPPRLTGTEVLGLLAAGMAVITAGAGTPELESAVSKLRDVVLPDSTEALVVQLPDPPFLPELRELARSHQVASIEYTGLASGETTQRDIEPWAVFSTMGNWYVRAQCRRAESERVFRLDRIRSLTPTGDTFEAPAEVDTTLSYVPGPDDVAATIRLASGARWVTDYYPVEVLDDVPEALTIEFMASDPMVTARLLLRLGAAAELVSGDEVGMALDALRSRLEARYGTGE